MESITNYIAAMAPKNPHSRVLWLGKIKSDIEEMQHRAMHECRLEAVKDDERPVDRRTRLELFGLSENRSAACSK